MVTPAGLVIDDRDEASRTGAKGVLGGGISNSTGGKRRDGGGGVVRAALHLVKRTGIGIEKGTGGAIGGNAGRSSGGVEIARPCGYKGACKHKTQAKYTGAFQVWC